MTHEVIFFFFFPLNAVRPLQFVNKPELINIVDATCPYFLYHKHPKIAIETLSTLDTMKIPLHREDQTKISFKIELNGSKLLYHNHQKEERKKRG